MIDLPSRRAASECSIPVPPFVGSTPALAGESDSGEDRSSLPSVPGYQILEELGEGGMGIVYKAYHLRLKRMAALKMIRPARASHKLRERFHREAEAVARLQHPNIVQIHEVGDHNGCPFLSLEYVEGGSLAHRLDGRPLDSRQAAAFLLPLAQAIHYAHDRGIVHRDLKPANVLLASGGSEPPVDYRTTGVSHPPLASLIPKIADFGLAKHLDDDIGLTREGDVLGTPSYVSPEQAGGPASAVGPRTDVYAVGAILYELLTGRPPFLAATVEETIKQVCQQDVVPPRRLVGHLPRDLDTICMKCLAKEPARRYASAAALAEDLRRFLEGEAILARPVGRLELAARWARRHPATTTLVACLLLAITALAVAIPVHIHLLNVQVRAGADEIQRLNRENLRLRVQGLLQQGRKARQRQEWEDARLRFTEVLDHLDAAPDLLDEELRRRQEEAGAELASVDRRLAEDKAAAERRRRYRELFRCRDEAFFLLNRHLFTPSQSSPSESIAAAQRGRHLFGLTDDALGEPDLRSYGAAEQDELRGGLFELLLIEAESLARSTTAQTPQRRNKQLDAALALLDGAARLSVDASSVHVRRARYLRQRGRVEEADREQRLADAQTPCTALGWFLRGYDLGLDDAHRRDAIRAFDEALHCRGNLFWVHFLRALAYQKQGEPSEARASLTVCVASRADFVWNHLLRGLVLIELDDLSAARADFDKAESLTLDAAARYVLHLNRGTLALKERKPAEAIRYFEKAVAGKPQWYQACVNLAEACGQLHRLDDAVRWLDRAIALNPDNAALYRARALLQQRRGQSSAALADLDEALRRLPRDRPSLERARCHFERGALLFLDKRYRPALQAFDDALAERLSPTEGRTPTERARLFANARLLRAQTLTKLKDYKTARDAFDAYLQLAPATASVWRQRAALDLKLEDYNGVLEDCSRALGLDKDADTLCLRGCAYLHFRLSKSALRDFEEVLRLQPKHVEALLWRGLAHVQRGNIEKGIADARSAVRLRPNSPDVRLRAARVFAQAVAVESADARAYEREAARLLRQAVELIRAPDEQRTFWSAQVRGDEALSPIANGLGFRALDQRFGPARR
jgi:tetratricopeptide (TPR) repeat protein/tRNA A-37 threonylcarbamoyl transferase component Bud32